MKVFYPPTVGVGNQVQTSVQKDSSNVFDPTKPAFGIKPATSHSSLDVTPLLIKDVEVTDNCHWYKATLILRKDRRTGLLILRESADMFTFVEERICIRDLAGDHIPTPEHGISMHDHSFQYRLDPEQQSNGKWDWKDCVESL